MPPVSGNVSELTSESPSCPLLPALPAMLVLLQGDSSESQPCYLLTRLRVEYGRSRMERFKLPANDLSDFLLTRLVVSRGFFFGRKSQPIIRSSRFDIPGCVRMLTFVKSGRSEVEGFFRLTGAHTAFRSSP